MLEVHENGSIRKNYGDVHHRILETNALVRAAPENEVVARILVCAAIGVQPALREELVRAREVGRVVVQ